ncbi:hypothetical protein Q31b_23540 [Novipirellula aureliae]|uniref:Uncharacterized protein n=1 Tax=Novipirellula aureliae TaxID=2527966 RepID=A0A5C6E772_9BACT|nr:hypothetical protein [Novipirellula aureliae]TWU43316.1 hypothetical protein Q31b_23540 [Novipirellula aureliae]
MDVELHHKAVEQTHGNLVAAADRFVGSLGHGGTNPQAIGQVVFYAHELSRLLPPEFHPPWLTELDVGFATAELDPHAGDPEFEKLTAFVVKNLPQISAPLLFGEQAEFDFDSRFDSIRDEAGVADAFDNLVSKIEAIIALDVIDSRVVQEALERLKAMLKRSRHGSFTAVVMSIHYGKFIASAFRKTLAKLPLVGPAFAAFDEAVLDAANRVQDAEAKMKSETVQRLINRQRLIA